MAEPNRGRAATIVVLLACVGAMGGAALSGGCKSSDRAQRQAVEVAAGRVLHIGTPIQPFDREPGQALGLLDPNQSRDYLSRWLLNLIYDPLLRYKANELVDLTTRQPKEAALVQYSERFADAISSHSLYTVKYQKPTQQCEGVISLQSGNSSPIFASGTYLRDPSQVDVSIRSFMDLLRQLYNPIVTQNRISLAVMTDGQLVGRINSSEYNACRSVIVELMMSLPRLYAKKALQGTGEVYDGTGLFRFAQPGTAVGKTVTLKTNRYSPAEKSIGLDQIEFRTYDDAPTLANGAPRLDMVISSYDVFKEARVEPPAGWRTDVLPQGTYYFAVVSPHFTREARVAIWHRILEPARKRLFDLGNLPKLANLRNNYWFPEGWDGTEVVRANYPAIKSEAYDVKLPRDNPATPLGGEIKVLLAGGISKNSGKEPFVGHVKNLLQANGFRLKALDVDDRNTDWSSYDLVLVRLEFDLLFADPSLLFVGTPIGSRILDLVSPPGTLLNQKMRLLPGLILSQGVGNKDVAQVISDVQSLFVTDPILFPLVTFPIYVFSNPATLRKGPRVNYREGFVRLEEWGIQLQAPVQLKAAKGWSLF